MANTLLHTAMYAEIGDKDFYFVKKLLAFPDIDINAKDGKGDSVLMTAVTSGFLEMVQLLLSQREIDLDTRDRRGMTLRNRSKEDICGNGKILKCLRDAERKRDKKQEEIEDELTGGGEK